MIENPAVRVTLSILNAFAIIAAAISAFFTSIEIGFMPILALAIKGFLLGSAISAVLYLATDSEGQEEDLGIDKKEDDVVKERQNGERAREFSFFLGFGLLSLYASILMIAGAVFLTTLLFFIVGILTIFSGASSRIVESADDFVILSAMLGIGVYLAILIGPWLWGIGLFLWGFGSESNLIGYAWFVGFIIVIIILVYCICIACNYMVSEYE